MSQLLHELLCLVLTPVRLLIDLFGREPPPASYAEAIRAYDARNPNDPDRLKSKAEAELWVRQRLGIREHDA